MAGYQCSGRGTSRNTARFTWLGGHPPPPGGRASESNRSRVGGEGQGLIVVPPGDVHACSRTNAASFKKFQQVSVALLDPTNYVVFSSSRMGEKHKAATAAAAGTLKFAQIAVRAGPASAQFGQQPGFEVGGDGMFQTLGFVVDAIPLHSEDLGEHALDEVMAKGELACDLASGRSQPDVAGRLHSHQAVFLQPAQSHSDRRRRDREPVSQRSRDNRLAFTLGLEDGLEVVLLGNGNHLGRLYDLSTVNRRLGD